MAGKWVLGKLRGLLVVDYGRLVERVLPAEHTLGLVRIELADPVAYQNCIPISAST